MPQNPPAVKLLGHSEWLPAWTLSDRKNTRPQSLDDGAVRIWTEATVTHYALNARIGDFRESEPDRGVTHHSDFSYAVRLNMSELDGLGGSLIIHEFGSEPTRTRRTEVQAGSLFFYRPEADTTRLILSIRLTGPGTGRIDSLEFIPLEFSKPLPLGAHAAAELQESANTGPKAVSPDPMATLKQHLAELADANRGVTELINKVQQDIIAVMETNSGPDNDSVALLLASQRQFELQIRQHLESAKGPHDERLD